jgi:hypothetical protein
MAVPLMMMADKTEIRTRGQSVPEMVVMAMEMEMEMEMEMVTGMAEKS